MVKKRRTSGSASASISGPASPHKSASPTKPGPENDGGDGAAAMAAHLRNGLGGIGLGGPGGGLGDEATAAGSSRAASASATPAPAGDERFMRMPAAVPGSGDAGPGEECFAYTDLPMNKNGYRYYACTLSPNPERGPTGQFYRTLPGPASCPPVHISWLDRSAFLRLSADASTLTTDRGYRSGRANVSIREGTWYFEVVIERGDGAGGAGRGTGGDTGNAHVRVGWARREANLDAPVGACAYSYGIRDVGGEKVHISRPRPYARGRRGFATGDVVGCMISLPARDPVEREDAPGFVKRWRIPLRYKGANYFEMDEYPVAKEMEALVNRGGVAPPPPAEDHEPKKKVKKQGGDKAPPKKADKPAARELHTLPGSAVRFFLNGEEMADAPAFEDLYDFVPLPPNEEHRYVGPRRGPVSVERERESYQYHDDGTLGYFPMVSCFGRGKARVNFGPEWEKPPVGADGAPVEVRPLVERWDEFRAEEVVHDEAEEARLAARYKTMLAEAAKPREPKRPAKKRRKTPLDGETPTSTPRMTPGFTPAPSSPKMASSPPPSSPHSEGGRARSEVPTLGVEREQQRVDVKPEPGDDPHEGVSWD